jgi:hypothetical protein
MGKFECTCGFGRQQRFDSNRQIHVKRELRDDFVHICKTTGYTEVRDPGFSQGRGIAYLVKNATGESNPHFILWNLIFDEIKKYTDNVEYSLTRGPDIVFTLADGRRVAVEVEATKKTQSQIMRKLEVLKKYAEWFFVVTKSENKKHYQGYGPTFTRKHVRDVIAAYFGVDLTAEPKTEPQ